jgi:hypothetical protein
MHEQRKNVLSFSQKHILIVCRPRQLLSIANKPPRLTTSRHRDIRIQASLNGREIHGPLIVE